MKRNRNRVLFLFFCLFIILHSGASLVYAEDQTIFEPEDIKTDQQRFSLSAPPFNGADYEDGLSVVTRNTPDKKIRREIIRLHPTMVAATETSTATSKRSDSSGKTTKRVSMAAISALTLDITSPLDGAEISRYDVMVRGTVTNFEGNETGVTVNGAIAMVCGDQFVANHVPLQAGNNIITANAKDADGNTAMTSISLYVNILEDSRDFISIKADTEVGILPFETTLRIDGAFSFTESSLTYTGPGEIEILEHPSPEEYRVRMTAEGLYYVTAEVIDHQGDIYRDTIAIHVLNKADLDALLKAKWEGMRSSLIAGDIEEALRYHHEVLKNKYEAIYNLLRANLPALAQQMQDIELIYAEDNRAKYRIRRDHEINGKNVTVTYYIYFSRDENGFWKIERY